MCTAITITAIVALIGWLAEHRVARKAEQALSDQIYTIAQLADRVEAINKEFE